MGRPGACSPTWARLGLDRVLEHLLGHRQWWRHRVLPRARLAARALVPVCVSFFAAARRAAGGELRGHCRAGLLLLLSVFLFPLSPRRSQL